jgi:hypothetical protein
MGKRADIDELMRRVTVLEQRHDGRMEHLSEARAAEKQAARVVDDGAGITALIEGLEWVEQEVRFAPYSTKRRSSPPSARPKRPKQPK